MQANVARVTMSVAFPKVLTLFGSPYIDITLSKAVFGEDCLVLNIYRPADIEPSTPIMIWIHGGGFQNGSGMSAYTNATYLTKAGFYI